MAEEWAQLLKQARVSHAPGQCLDLPREGVTSAAFINNILLVRDCFPGLYTEVVKELKIHDAALCHVNGNSGVGKSSFLWYFIIRTAIEQPLSLILYETEAFLWEFRGSTLKVVPKPDYPFNEITSPNVAFHLIDQRIYPSRPIGRWAVVAASPDEDNTKSIRKVRYTFTRYLPPWDKIEFDMLVTIWASRAANVSGILAERILEKVQAADLAFTWFGGIPRILWDREAGTLTEKQFGADVNSALANTKLKNVTEILQNASRARNISWKLFHFSVNPKSKFRSFDYTFCSEKVAHLYADYLCRTNVNKIRTFLEASQPFPEYSALRGFVFEQFVIGQALSHNIMAMPMVDNVYCQRCSSVNDQGTHNRIPWVQCNTCLKWYHATCANFNITFHHDFNCGCNVPPPQLEAVSNAGLLLRYYEGDLEDTLLAAGKDAIKYLWRPLKKNNAVFDFVLLPRTLGQATVSGKDHRPPLEATIKAQKALTSWRSMFYASSGDDDTLLVFFVTTTAFPDFKFQSYRSSGKVALKAVKGLVQCKVAVPVSGSPYAMELAKSTNMDVVALDPNAPETWEVAASLVDCPEEVADLPEKSLVHEKFEYCRRKLAFHADDLEALEDIKALEDSEQKSRRLKALSRLHHLRGDLSDAEIVFALEREKLNSMEMD